MMKLVAIVILFAFTNLARGTDIGHFESCYKERASKIPSKPERAFLDSYLTYLKSGTPANGETVISQMQELAKRQNGKFSVEWASIFEGTMELCCDGPHTCSESFGSTSGMALRPRVEKGWLTAIYVVLMYERLAKTDGADAEGLNGYLGIIRSKHPWAITLFKKKYPQV
ncbi:MAG: hypothetical protein IPK68_13115 [Bdellovibrionales bacterium]|nr:hypothetical protein [Bdellovibrionales bacterium]